MQSTSLSSDCTNLPSQTFFTNDLIIPLFHHSIANIYVPFCFRYVCYTQYMLLVWLLLKFFILFHFKLNDYVSGGIGMFTSPGTHRE